MRAHQTKGYFENGVAALKKGEIEAAHHFFTLALNPPESAENRFEANFYLGKIQHHIGNFESAYTSFKLSLQSCPQNEKLHHAAGLALYKLDKFHDALAEFQLAMANGDEPSLQYIQNLAAAHFAIGDPENLRDAVTQFKNIYKQKPNCAIPRYNLALTYHKLCDKVDHENAMVCKQNAINTFEAVWEGKLENTKLSYQVHSGMRLMELQPEAEKLDLAPLIQKLNQQPKETLNAQDLLICIIACSRNKLSHDAEEASIAFFSRYSFNDIPYFLREEIIPVFKEVWGVKCKVNAVEKSAALEIFQAAKKASSAKSGKIYETNDFSKLQKNYLPTAIPSSTAGAQYRHQHKNSSLFKASNSGQSDSGSQEHKSVTPALRLW